MYIVWWFELPDHCLRSQFMDITIWAVAIISCELSIMDTIATKSEIYFCHIMYQMMLHALI